MANWKTSVITDKGLLLLSKIQIGDSITFTKALSGSGVSPENELSKQTVVKDAKQNMQIESAIIENDKAVISLLMTNTGLNNSYQLSQIGIYANDPDEGEILYFIAQATNPDIIPTEAESPGYVFSPDVNFSFGNAENIEISINPLDFVTQGQFEGHKTNGTHTWNNIIGKPSAFPPSSHIHTKNEIGLPNVDNTADINKNVLSATKLATPRTINGVNFNGTANITVVDNTKSPINHASSGTSYGVGSASAYGHVKLINNSTTNASGTGALDAYQGKVLNDRINEFNKDYRKIIIGLQGVHDEKYCDYLADNTNGADLVINQAIQDLTNGGKIVILSGEYIIKSNIFVDKNNIAINGEGYTTELKREFNSSYPNQGIITLKSNISYCIVNSIKINGNKSLYTSLQNEGISLNESNECNIIKDLYCINNGVAIGTGYKCKNNIITQNKCNYNNTGIAIQNGTIDNFGNIVQNNSCYNNNIGYSLSSIDNNIIASNISNNNTNGFVITDCKNLIFTNNIAKDNAEDGIRLNRTEKSVIANNIVLRGTGLTTDYNYSQNTIFLLADGNNYNFISDNLIMGKNYVSNGGIGNTFVNNKYN